MLKAAGRDGKGRPLVILGLSGENMTRLMADEPMVVDLAEFGLTPIQIVLVGGRTEKDIAISLREHGLLTGEGC